MESPSMTSNQEERQMRRIVMFNRVAANGSFAARDGGMDGVVPEPELDRAAADNLGEADAILFGRRTYEMFESFWPQVRALKAGPGKHMDGLRRCGG
jgi:dihydrofolate reductase